MQGISYDYKTIKVKREMEAIVTDTYENLGWELSSTSSVEHSLFYISLSFKRNRKQNNKVELLKLQEQADNIIATIEDLQAKKKQKGMIPSILTGVFGSLVFGGGMSLCLCLTKSIGAMIGGIALGLFGVGICALAYPIFKKLNKTANSKIQPILETELDKLSDICEKASSMAKND